jgi:hypothetical protein
LTLKIEPLWKEAKATVGNSFNLRFKATISSQGPAKEKLGNVGVLIFLAPGIWQHRETAKPLGGGIYEINFVPPQPGIYYVYFQSPSLNIRYSDTRPLTIEAVKASTAANN